jgi:hypothetical protein
VTPRAGRRRDGDVDTQPHTAIVASHSGHTDGTFDRSKVLSALETLTKLEIAKESTGKRRDRLFAYPRYLHILSEGMEPLRIREFAASLTTTYLVDGALTNGLPASKKRSGRPTSRVMPMRTVVLTCVVP